MDDVSVQTACLTEDQVLDWLDRALSAEAKKAVEQHVEGCLACRALLAACFDSLREEVEADDATLVIERFAFDEDDGDTVQDTPRDLQEMFSPLLETSASVQTDPRIGREIGDWTLEACLGAGAFSRVYRAVPTKSKPPLVSSVSGDSCVAIKLLQLGVQPEQGALYRFRQEAKAIFGLQHPNIVRLLDFGVLWEDGSYYLILEQLKGMSLQQLLRTGHQWSLVSVHRLGQQVCEALSYIHAKGIVHRDIKPANLMLIPQGGQQLLPWETQHWQVKLIDFGLASLLEGTRLTRSGALLGTPAYMSPEQAMGRAYVADERADLYALGVILFELLVQRRPFPSRSRLELLLDHMSLAPLGLSDCDSDRPWAPQLEAFFQAVLAKEPLSRPTDATTFNQLWMDAMQTQILLELDLS